MTVFPPSSCSSLSMSLSLQILRDKWVLLVMPCLALPFFALPGLSTKICRSNCGWTKKNSDYVSVSIKASFSFRARFRSFPACTCWRYFFVAAAVSNVSGAGTRCRRSTPTPFPPGSSRCQRAWPALKADQPVSQFRKQVLVISLARTTARSTSVITTDSQSAVFKVKQSWGSYSCTTQF